MSVKTDLLYDINDKPPVGKALLLSFQHVFAMFGATILVPILVGLPVSVALFCSGIGTIIYLVITGFISNGLIFAMFLAFFIPGLAYGKTIGVINNSNDLIATMTKSMQSMGGYLVLAFFASQFVAYFSHTNLGIILSVKGAEFLEAIGLSGIPLITVFILLCAFINLFMGSASAKWAIMAPIFVPMMYHMGISPALTQVAYRIGDSTTNIISPLMSYFAMIVVFMQRYDKEKGLGTLISTMVPYSISFLITWTILLMIWMFIGLPLGPGAALYI